MKIFWRVVLGLLAVVVLVVAYFLVFVYFKPHVDYLKAEVEVVVSGEQLFHDFVSDPAGAAATYNGRVLLVEGVVDQVEEEEGLVVAVMVFDDGFFGQEGVRFTMLEGQQGKVAAGRHMQIKGFCTGYTGADVILENASVPSP